MGKLIVQLVADFLRDDPTTAGKFGEDLRCDVLQREGAALQAYGLDQSQINVLLTRNRQAILDKLTEEIGAVMDELDVGGTGGIQYPGGVHVREAKLIINSANKDRTILVRGSGYLKGATMVNLVPGGGGAPIACTIEGESCDHDVWQRVYVKANVPNAGTYSVEVSSGGGKAAMNIKIP